VVKRVLESAEFADAPFTAITGVNKRMGTRVNHLWKCGEMYNFDKDKFSFT